MKTNYFKIVMPVIAVIFAIGGSFATFASEKSTQTSVIGYVSYFTSCDIAVACGTLGPVCTATVGGNVYQAFGKFSINDTACPILRRKF